MDKAAIQKLKRCIVKGERQKQVVSSPIDSTSYDKNVILSQSSNSEEIDEDYESYRYSKGCLQPFKNSLVCYWVDQGWCFI